MSNHCTCRFGRDHDGSEFGPCEYCERMHDEEREDQMDEYNEYFVSCKSPNGSDWFYGPFDSRSQAKSWAKGTLKAIPFEVNGLVSEHYGPPVDEE